MFDCYQATYLMVHLLKNLFFLLWLWLFRSLSRNWLEVVSWPSDFEFKALTNFQVFSSKYLFGYLTLLIFHLVPELFNFLSHLFKLNIYKELSFQVCTALEVLKDFQKNWTLNCHQNLKACHFQACNPPRHLLAISHLLHFKDDNIVAILSPIIFIGSSALSLSTELCQAKQPRKPRRVLAQNYDSLILPG